MAYSIGVIFGLRDLLNLPFCHSVILSMSGQWLDNGLTTSLTIL